MHVPQIPTRCRGGFECRRKCLQFTRSRKTIYTRLMSDQAQGTVGKNMDGHPTETNTSSSTMARHTAKSKSSAEPGAPYGCPRNTNALVTADSVVVPPPATATATAGADHNQEQRHTQHRPRPRQQKTQEHQTQTKAAKHID